MKGQAMSAKAEKTQVEGVYLPHPLFPVEGESAPFEVSYIQIARKEGASMVFIPETWRAEELYDTKQILERFGGGTYELYARSFSPTDPAKPYRITKRRLITLPGKP